jgi:hypothetical protein
MPRKTTSSKSTSGRQLFGKWWRRIPVWLDEYLLVLVVAVITFFGSFNHLTELSGKHGQHGLEIKLSAGCFDLMAIFFTREMQRDERINRARKLISAPLVFLLFYIALTLAANIATIPPGQKTVSEWIWDAVFAAIEPVSCGIVVAFLHRRAAWRRRQMGTGTTAETVTGNPPAKTAGTGTGNQGTGAGNPAGTGTGNQAGGKPGTDERAGGVGPDRLVPPAPGKPEAIIPEGYVITAGPHTIESEARAARAAAGAFLAVNGRRPLAKELGRTCRRRNTWAGPQLDRLRDVPDAVLLAEAQQEGAVSSR